MKTRNKVISGAAALLIGTGVVFAGGWGGHHGHGGGHGFGMSGLHHGKALTHLIKRVGDRLDLSDAQKQEIRSIVEAHKEPLRAGRMTVDELRQSAMSLDPTGAEYDAQVESMVAEVSTLAAEQARLAATMYKEIASVLTPEQMAELRTKMTHRMEKMSRRMEKSHRSS